MYFDVIFLYANPKKELRIMISQILIA